MNELQRMEQRRRNRRKRMIICWAQRIGLAAVVAILAAGIVFTIKCIAANNADEVKAETQETEKPAAAVETEEPEIIIIETKEDTYSLDWDAYDTYLLAKIAMAEAEGESVEGKAMVIRVVLNRANGPAFPNSIQEVIEEHRTNSKGKEVYQFTPAAPGGRYHTVEPNRECFEAVMMVMSGWDESEGALYFEATYNESDWHRNTLSFIKTIGNHNFYK